MSRLNTRTPVQATSPIKTVSGTARTHEGGKGYVNDAYGEAFRLGVSLMAGEGTFYESGKSRDARFTGLIEQLAVSDPTWTLNFLRWLRQEGNIRTASLMGAAHAVHARLAAGVEETLKPGEKGFNRMFIAAVPQRADEPGELAAYWVSTFGRTIPSAVKRGLSDAANRLFNEYSLMKYDTASHGWRFGDVIQMAHVTPADETAAALFKMAMNKRYGNDPFDGIEMASLPRVVSNMKLREAFKSDPTVLLNPAALKGAAFTWEDALSLAGEKLDKGELWSSLILSGSVGHMAMIRNLRNMQAAGISAEATAKVQADVSNPEIVAKGRQFPYRYWSAYKNASGTQWAHPLEVALGLSVSNIPELSGQTDVYIDTSGSMGAPMSDKSSIRRDEAAAVFGVATALRNPGSRVFMFGTDVKEVRVRKGDSLLRSVNEIVRRNGEVGWGTNTGRSIRATTSPSTKRVVIFTDMQSFGGYGSDVSTAVPPSTYIYAYDLAGYEHGDIPSGNGRRHQLAGLSDSSFKIMDLIERSHQGHWPWES